ncbi:MAG: hypothetical protein J6Q42_06225 [Clostridia bacterium]|nr:hypothetical protein [Clostridia bacterium]
MEQPPKDIRTEKGEELRIVVAGRFPSPQEAVGWLRLLNGPAYTLLWCAVVLLSAVFLFGTLAQLVGTPWYLRGAIVAFIASCCFLSMSQLSRFKKQEITSFFALFSDRKADKKAVEMGYTFAFYDDRVVSTSLRGSDTIWFSDVVMCTESAGGFALQTKTAVLFLRSADLTAYDLQCIRAHLHAVISASRQHIKAMAIPGLTEALPIPRFFNFDNIAARAVVSARSQAGRRRRRVKALLLPLLLLFSILPALLWQFTPWLLLNLVISAVIFGSVGLWIASALERKLSGVADLPDLQLAFTKDGLAVLCAGVTEFTVKERLNVRITNKKVHIRYTNGEQLTIPLSAVDRPESLKTLWLNDASGI